MGPSERPQFYLLSKIPPSRRSSSGNPTEYGGTCRINLPTHPRLIQHAYVGSLYASVDMEYWFFLDGSCVALSLLVQNKLSSSSFAALFMDDFLPCYGRFSSSQRR